MNLSYGFTIATEWIDVCSIDKIFFAPKFDRTLLDSKRQLNPQSARAMNFGGIKYVFQEF